MPEARRNICRIAYEMRGEHFLKLAPVAVSEGSLESREAPCARTSVSAPLRGRRSPTPTVLMPEEREQ